MTMCRGRKKPGLTLPENFKIFKKRNRRKKIDRLLDVSEWNEKDILLREECVVTNYREKLRKSSSRKKSKAIIN